MATGKRTKIMCVTTSCCSIYFLTIEIWSETTCHYVEIQEKGGKDVCVYTFNGKKEINEEFKLEQPVLLAGIHSSDGKNLVLPAGGYKIVKNEFEFIPQQTQSKKYCYIREVKGQFLGHSYHYEIEICISISIDFLFGDKGIVQIGTNLSEEEIKKVLDSGGEISFDEDVTIQEKEVNFTLEKGKYILNSDGNIYLQNIKVK